MQGNVPLNIAFVVINANRREGTSRAVVEVAERLGTKHNVTVVSRTFEDVDRSVVQWKKITAPSWPDVAEFEAFRVSTERMLRRQQFDIVHSAGCNVWNADVYAIQTVHPIKMQVNERLGRNANVGVLRRLTRAWYDHRVLHSERMSYRKTNRRGVVGYLPVSIGTKSELVRCYSLDEEFVQVIPNGSDLSIFDPSRLRAGRETVRKEFDCTAEDIVYLFAGGEWKRKALDLAMESFAKATAERRVLVIAGDDPEKARYQVLAARLGISDRVRWLGFRSDINRVFSASDVLLFPSAYEAFSLATIEAAASGLPVIMCDISGAQELVGDGSCGRMVERDPNAISKVIDQMAADKFLRESMGANGRDRVRKQFHWDLIADQTEQFYHQILEARRSVVNRLDETSVKQS